jgi:hypothetical protein
MSIYEVQSLPDGEALVIERRYILLFCEAFAAYEKGDFKKAITVFENCLKQKSSDMIVKILLERSFEFQKNGAPKDWDGTIILHEK